MKWAYDVLLVEDSDDDAFFFARALKHAKTLRLVYRACSGNDAIAYLSASGQYVSRRGRLLPDVIVLDLKMPGLSGFEVLEWLGRQKSKPKVCVYSSSEEPDDIQKAMALGADCFIPKGFHPEQLVKLVRAVERTCDQPPA